MATPQRSRVESLLGIPMPRRPMPSARRPEPARALTPSRPALERRAERVEPEKARPAKGAEANTVKAIVIDPQAKTVREVRIATAPGDQRGGFGRQIADGAAEAIVGADELEALDLQSGDVVVVDPLMQEDREALWRLGDVAPVAGVGVVVGYDADGDEYRDTSLNADEARRSIKWDADDDGDADPEELRAAIVDRLEALDGKQLQKLQAMLDEIDAAGEDDADEPTAGPRMAVRSPPKTKPTG